MSVWVPVNDEFTIFEREELFVASVVRKDKKSKTLKENTVGMMIRFSGRDCLPRRAEKKKEEIETGDLFFPYCTRAGRVITLGLRSSRECFPVLSDEGVVCEITHRESDYRDVTVP